MTRRPTTIPEIARRAGVTNATVSRALRHSPLVKEATRERVLRIAGEMNYRISTAARGLVTGRTQTVGFMTPSLRYPLNAEVAECFQQVLSEMNYGLLIASLDNQDELALSRLKIFSERCVDGIILQPTMSKKDVSCVEMIRQHQIPFVVSTEVPQYDVSFVSFDNYDCAYQLTRHVVEQGYRHPAMITSWPSLAGTPKQTQAFRDVLTEAKCMDPEPVIVHQEQFDSESIVRMIEGVLAAGKVDCLIITDSVIAMHACLYLKSRNVRIGPQIGLAAAEDTPWFDASNLSITGLRHPLREIARTLVSIKKQINPAATIRCRCGSPRSDGGRFPLRSCKSRLQQYL